MASYSPTEQFNCHYTYLYNFRRITLRDYTLPIPLAVKLQLETKAVRANHPRSKHPAPSLVDYGCAAHRASLTISMTP
jgi:hypothetical protein